MYLTSLTFKSFFISGCRNFKYTAMFFLDFNNVTELILKFQQLKNEYHLDSKVIFIE